MSTINVDIIQSASASNVTINDDLIVTGTNNIRPYKVYTALISQNGTNNPTVVILENTIGNIVWTRDTFGVYSGTLTGAFTSGQTALFIQDKYSFSNIVVDRLDVWIERQDVNVIAIYTLNQTVLIDDVLDNTTIEIRVYN